MDLFDGHNSVILTWTRTADSGWLR